MAFDLGRFTRVSEAMNSGQFQTNYNPDPTVVYINGPGVFSYASAIDTIATIGGANYFAEQVNSLSVNDLIFCVGSDASLIYQVATVDADAGTITVAAFTPAGTVGTANITNLAVTTAKIANNAVTATQLGNNAVGSAQLATDIIQYASVTMTAAQFIAMYATPFSIIAAPAAGNMVVIDKVVLTMDYGTTAYTGGGAINLQYGNTAHAAGPAASATIAAANVEGSASVVNAAGGAISAVATTAIAATAVYISNATAAFATGDSTFTVNVWYKIVPST